MVTVDNISKCLIHGTCYIWTPFYRSKVTGNVKVWGHTYRQTNIKLYSAIIWSKSRETTRNKMFVCLFVYRNSSKYEHCTLHPSKVTVTVNVLGQICRQTYRQTNDCSICLPEPFDHRKQEVDWSDCKQNLHLTLLGSKFKVSVCKIWLYVPSS